MNVCYSCKLMSIIMDIPTMQIRKEKTLIIHFDINIGCLKKVCDTSEEGALRVAP